MSANIFSFPESINLFAPKKRPPILVIRGQGWLFWLCYSMLFIQGYVLLILLKKIICQLFTKNFTKLYNFKN